MHSQINFFLLLLLLFISNFMFGQMTHDIKNKDGDILGKLEIEAFILKNGEPDLLGNNSNINTSDSKNGEFGLRLNLLEWDENKGIKINANEVTIFPTTPGLTRLKKGLHKWTLKKNNSIDIKFSAKPSEKSRSFDISIKYSADGDKIKGEIKRNIILIANITKTEEKVTTKDSSAIAEKIEENIITKDSAIVEEKEIKEEISPIQPTVIEEQEENIDASAERTWEEISKDNPAHLLHYTQTFATNKADNAIEYVKDARRLYDKLDNDAWNKAEKQNRYKRYIEYFPTGKHIGAAKKRQAEIRKSKKRQEESPEEKAWLVVEKNPTKENLHDFLEKFPEGVFANEAKEILMKDLPIEYKITSESSNANNEKVFVLQFSNVSTPRLTDRHPSSQIEFDKSSFLTEHQLKVIFKGISKYEFKVEDVNLKKDTIISLDNTLLVELTEKDTNTFVFNIQRGLPPYRIDFLKKDSKVAELNDKFINIEPDKNGNHTITKALMEDKGMEGVYNRIQIWDATATITNHVEKSVNIHVSKSPARSFLYIILPLAFLSLIALFMYKNRLKRLEIQEQYEKHQNEMEETPEKAKKTTTPPVEATTKDSDNKSKLQIKKAKRVSTPDAPPPDKTKAIKSGKLKMKWRQENNGLMSLDKFTTATSNPDYYQKQLTEHWDNTEISDVFLGKECIIDLGKFLREENLSRVVEEQLGMIPEIGGFLLGNYALDEKLKKYQVSINKFVPFVPEYSDVYKIEIGTDTLVKELADAQDQNPNMAVIGWFHTHPGHGLFLSKPDLAVQRHFPQPYQLAMEIDSMTTRLDTAFFTRQSDGRMNNSSDRKTKNWFAWTNIDPSTKGRK